MGTTPRPDDVADVIPLVRPARWDWVPRTKLFRPPTVEETVLDPDLLDRTARAVDDVLPRGDVDGQAEDLLRLRTVIDKAAREAGRDPSEIGTALRVNAGAGIDVDGIAEGTRRLVERTGFTDVFVDPMYVAPGVDAVRELFADLIRRPA